VACENPEGKKMEFAVNRECSLGGSKRELKEAGRKTRRSNVQRAVHVFGKNFNRKSK